MSLMVTNPQTRSPKLNYINSTQKSLHKNTENFIVTRKTVTNTMSHHPNSWFCCPAGAYPRYLALRSGSPVYRPSTLTFRQTDDFPISLMHVVFGLWKKVGGKKPTQGEYANSLHRHVMHNIISSVKCKCWCLFVSQCGTMTNADFVVYLNLSGTGSSRLATASVED